ncbi:TonB family protein [Stenotrophomonas sp.]|uniref:TonB family protein n=1 Tax=Stenotrophomonas sp. TaxID=69392 RepID=UPI0028A8F154|nr:TonB family protein [Stenotrophomonas sp.]
MHLKHVSAFLIAVPLVAAGQQPAEAPERLRPVMIIAGSAHYPQELADKGVQGQAVFSTEVRVDGTFAPSVLVEPSGSAELDAAAIKVVAGVRAKPQKVAKAVLLPVLFYKDSVNNLHLKTCAQFNTDLAYFATTFPTRPADEMNIFNMAAAVVTTVGGVDMSSIGKLSSAPQKTVEACAKRPKRLFMEEFMKSVGK